MRRLVNIADQIPDPDPEERLRALVADVMEAVTACHANMEADGYCEHCGSERVSVTAPTFEVDGIERAAIIACARAQALALRELHGYGVVSCYCNGSRDEPPACPYHDMLAAAEALVARLEGEV